MSGSKDDDDVIVVKVVTKGDRPPPPVIVLSSDDEMETTSAPLEEKTHFCKFCQQFLSQSEVADHYASEQHYQRMPKEWKKFRRYKEKNIFGLSLIKETFDYPPLVCEVCDIGLETPIDAISHITDNTHKQKMDISCLISNIHGLEMS